MIDPARILERQRRWRTAAVAGAAAAQEDATEAFIGCAAALRTIGSELAALDYPVRSIVVPPTSDLDALVRDLERRARIVVPLVLVAFWRHVGGVSFVDLGDYAHVAFWEAAGVSGEYCCDGVMVDACTQEWVDFCVGDIEDQADDDGPRVIALSPDDLHKDNVSGGSPYGVASDGGWLAAWENFGWGERPASAPPDPPDFLGYLRTAILECAGFPGLYGDPAFEPIRQRLLRDVRLF